jgi:ubiquinol-cytochrome c reductase cytochrome b subunit
LFAISVVLPVFLPWLDRSRVRSIRYRGWMYKTALTVFVVSFLMLGWLGLQPATTTYVVMARIFSVLYFLFFLLMPWYTAIDKTKPVPERVVYHG